MLRLKIDIFCQLSKFFLTFAKDIIRAGACRSFRQERCHTPALFLMSTIEMMRFTNVLPAAILEMLAYRRENRYNSMVIMRRYAVSQERTHL